MQDRGERHSLQKTVRRKEEPQGGGASPGIKRPGKASAGVKGGVDRGKGSGELEGARVRPKGKLPALEQNQQQGEGGGSMEGSPAMRKGQLPPLEQQEQDMAVDEVAVERGDASLGVVATERGGNRTEESVVVVPAAASAAEVAAGAPSGNTEGEGAAPGGNREGDGSGQEESAAQARAQESKPAVTPVHKGKQEVEGAVGMNASGSQTASSDPVSTLMVSPYQLRFNRTPATRNLPRPLTERGPLHKPLYAVSPNDGSKSAREHSGSNHTPSKKKSRHGKTPAKEASAHSLGQLSSSSLVSPGGGTSVPVDLLYGPKGPMLTYGVKQRYVERPGARPEGIIQMPFGRYFELREPVNVHEVWSQESMERLPSRDLSDRESLEDVDYPVGLSNFEEHPGARINSPLSVRALEAAGCLTEDLGKQTLEEMISQAGGDEEVGALRYEFHVKSRAGLMAILMEHRAKLERSAMGVGPRELGTLTKSGRSRGTGGSKMEGSADKGRHSIERVKAMERRRMEILLKSHIAAKDRVKDLQEKLSDKFDAKARMLEEMREELRERNVRKYEQHYEKREELVQKLEEAQEEKERAIRAKQQVAEQAALEAQNKVMRRIELKKELQRLRNMQHEERKIMAARAIETSRKKKQEKAAGVLEAYEVRNQHRESLLEQRRDMYRKFHHDRELFNHVVEEYRERGTFSKLASKVEIISQFLELDPSSVPIDFEDRNPSAYLLHRNQHVHGSVAKGEYSYFKFRHSTMDRVSITLKSSLGDPDLYVGNHTCPWPNAEACVWKKEQHGDDRLVLHSFDKHFNVGFMYIGIRGTTDSNYSLLVKWREEASPGEESLGDDVRQELAKQRMLQVAEEASKDMGESSQQHGDPASLEAKERGSDGGHVEVGEGGEGGAAAQNAGDGDNVEKVDEGGVSRSKDEADTAGAREARGSSKKKHGVVRKVKHAQTVEVREVEAVSRQEERVDMDDWVRRLTYTQVCEWLASVGVNEMSIQLVREDRVPGSQLLTMTEEELMDELAMTKLQARRVINRVVQPPPMPQGHGIDMDELLDWQDDEAETAAPPTVAEVDKPNFRDIKQAFGASFKMFL